MASKKQSQIQEEVAPNLIPMIDIMFLLLLFFMLGADMGQRDLEDVTLPIARSVKEDKDTKGKEKDRLTINIYHSAAGAAADCAATRDKAGRVCQESRHWRIAVRKGDYTDAAKLDKLLREEADQQRSGASAASASERRVMVRADGGAPYGLVEDVMRACSAVGIYQIECGASPPVAERKG